MSKIAFADRASVAGIVGSSILVTGLGETLSIGLLFRQPLLGQLDGALGLEADAGELVDQLGALAFIARHLLELESLVAQRLDALSGCNLLRRHPRKTAGA